MKRLVVCCDGTWNRPDATSPTNVVKLSRAVAAADATGTQQLVCYHRGVGTDRFERIRGGAFGLGLSRHVRDCYRFVVDHYEPGDELFFFGFSRGAYTARSTVGLIRNAGVLRREHRERVDDAYGLYRGRGDARHPNGAAAEAFRRRYSYDDVAVRFVGVWDTVGALGIPGVPKLLAGRLWAFHDTQLSSRVAVAYQALAIDERRRPFTPSLWYRKAGDDKPLEQRWFAGVHSDIGGGYPACALAEVALVWMASKAAENGLALDPDALERFAPDPNGELHDSFSLLYRPLRPHTRSLEDPTDPFGWVGLAASVGDRRDYRAANLEAYRAKHVE
jgi:uncharacterized protein (DUF2235 family)